MTSSKPDAFRLQLLGPPSLRDASGGTPRSLGWGKPLALLCLLAVRREVPRDEVVDLLWRDVDEGHARNAFRQALHRLRSALGDEILPPDRERLRLSPSPRLVVDLEAFEAAATAGRLEEAMPLYTGDFLENADLGEQPFDMWVEHERTRLRALFKQVLYDAATRAARDGRWAEAVAASRRLLSLAPFDTGAAQLAATTLVSAGRRIEAHGLLQQFVARLEAELGLPVPAEIRALLARIERSDRPRSGAPADGASVAPEFVEREAVLSQLLSLIRTTGTDAGGLALIEGDAGIGKSRLVQEVAAHARTLGSVTVLSAREHGLAAAIPFGAIIEAIRPLVRAPGVAGASRHLLAEAARLLPELRDTFDLPAVGEMEDDPARLRFFEGIAALVDAAAFEQPILLVLEDLHFIAPSTLDLLSYLCVRLAGSAVTFILTIQTSHVSASTLARLRSLSGGDSSGSPPHGSRAQRHVLQPLTRAAATRAAEPLARQLGVSAGAVDRVVHRAEGSPARLVELLRRVGAGEDVASLPVSMSALITERVQRLSSAQRRLLTVLSLLKRPASVELAASAAHLSISAARESLTALVQNGLVRREDSGEFVASEFASQCAQEIAGEATRAFLSGWIADALAREPRGGTTDGELAALYAAAGLPARAFGHARRAAFHALTVGAVPEAVQLFNAARTFATSAEQQDEIESALTSIGSGRRRLPSDVRPLASLEARGDAAETVSTPRGEPDSAAVAPSWERLFPNWRLLLGAAVATLIVSATVLAPRRASSSVVRPEFTDTLVLASSRSTGSIWYVTGDLTGGFSMSDRVSAAPGDPAWVDSLARPWATPLPAPRGGRVALSRVTATGSDVYIISADRRDTVAVVIDQGDARPLAWSPDAQWLLARTSRTLPEGSFDSDLFAYRVNGRGVSRVAVDSASRRAVIEASWSPDGARIAWVARVGSDRSSEVFVSPGVGGAVRNVSRHPADDEHIAWSGDGELLAFTSTRDGNAELYAVSFREDRLWRLTFDDAHDDAAAFSRSGRLVAFESTRGGAAGVYIMPALGGEPQPVGMDFPAAIIRWQSGPARYVDRLRVEPVEALAPGDTGRVRLRVLDQFNIEMTALGITWTILDSALLSRGRDSESVSDSLVVVGRRPGLARVVASVGAWRSDTALVRVGSGRVVVAGGPAQPFATWQPLGVPSPTMVNRGRNAIVFIDAGRERESGILSREAGPLLPGLTLSASIIAPIGAATDPATGVSAAFTAPEEPGSIAPAAPQFLRYASFSWSAETGRLVYAVGREVFSEPAALVGAALPIALRISIEADSTVSFHVGERQRWRSTLRIIDPRYDSRVHAWIGARAARGVLIENPMLALEQARSFGAP